MYTRERERAVESVCYEQEHINQVMKIIKSKFGGYFEKFLINEGKAGFNESNVKEIAKKLGMDGSITKKDIDKTQSYKSIIFHGLADFEKNRQKYLDIMDKETLEEHRDDPFNFKSKTMRNECPIINSTLNYPAKALDKYKRDFKLCKANELLEVVTNLNNFAVNYKSSIYNSDNYDNIAGYADLFFSELDTQSCTLYGVIGGGIKSHLLYKLFPSAFPNRSRESIWALWYLSDKTTLGCQMDSEFLMIDIDKCITQQNYFYPYELFAFYAHQIYQLLRNEAKILGVHLEYEYRYVIVDTFLSFIAGSHTSEISLLTNQIGDSDNGYV